MSQLQVWIVSGAGAHLSAQRDCERVTTSAWVLADKPGLTDTKDSYYHTQLTGNPGDPWTATWFATDAEDAPAPSFALEISCHDSAWRLAHGLKSWQHAGVVYPLDENNGTLYGMIPDSSLDNDTDRDGMPDWWEILYFGDLSQGPYDDFDGDGLLNIEEYHLSPIYGGTYENGWAGESGHRWRRHAGWLGTPPRIQPAG